MSVKVNIARLVVGIVRVLIPIVIIALAVWGFRALLKSRPSAPKTARQTSTPYVTVQRLAAEDYHRSITAYGTVQPSRELRVQPQVSGRVIEQNSKLIAGGTIRKGEILIAIDPADFRAAIEQAEAEVIRAEFELALEEGNQRVAKREWELLGSTIEADSTSKELALRVPHLKERRAALMSAKSRLEQARLNLQRTIIYAPFDAIVQEESVEIGQVASPQASFATLVGTDAFQVQASIPFSELGEIRIPNGKSGEPSRAVILVDIGESSIEREGWVRGVLSDVDPASRMARLLIDIDDPLGVHNPEHALFPLLIGAYVQVRIAGSSFSKAFVIPRASLRQGDVVWLVNDANELEIRSVSVGAHAEGVVIITAGVREGEMLITSALPAAQSGMPVKPELEQSRDGAEE